MNEDQSHEELLREVLNAVVQSNQQTRPGTPMAELKTAIETALAALPPLEFKKFEEAISDTGAAEKFVHRAPEVVGWNADKVVEWVEQIAQKVKGAS
jgi:hypothetical protein